MKILKGILLWTTVAACVLLVSGIDSLVQGAIWFSACVILCILCYKTITFRELISLSLYKWFYKKFYHEIHSIGQSR